MTSHRIPGSPVRPVTGRTGGPSPLETLRRALRRNRRPLAAALLAVAAVLTAVTAVRPLPPPTVTVLVAAHDLRGGTALSAADLRPRAMPASVTPVTALRPGARLTGRMLAGPVRQGEVLTETRLIGATLLTGYGQPGSGLVAAPVRIADADSVDLLQPGDRIDVLAAVAADGVAAMASLAMATVEEPGAAGLPRTASPPVGGPSAVVVAADIRVLTVPQREADRSARTALGEGALVVLATSPETAMELARAAVTARLSYTLRSG